LVETLPHDWLRRRYLDEGASLRELAVQIGCSMRAVRKALAEAQVTPRPQGRWVKRSSNTGSDGAPLLVPVAEQGDMPTRDKVSDNHRRRAV
jgi:hypothetical protein